MAQTPEAKARRAAIEACNTCDHNGMADILPRTKDAHETRARCPHNAHRLVEIKQRAQTDQTARQAAPGLTPFGGHGVRRLVPSE